jgi:plastocyanin
MPETTFIAKDLVESHKCKRLQPTEKPAESAAPAKPRNKNLVLVGIVIVVLVVVGVGAYQLFNSGGTSPKGTQITMFDGGCAPVNPPNCGFKDANGSNSTTITSGNSVYWKNTGVLPHTATSCDSTNSAKYGYTCPQSNGSLASFDTSTVAAGASSNSVTLTTKGTYYYFCSVHSFMHGKLLIQ